MAAMHVLETDTCLRLRVNLSQLMMGGGCRFHNMVRRLVRRQPQVRQRLRVLGAAGIRRFGGAGSAGGVRRFGGI